MKIAITGASGYIGSYLVSFFQADGHDVYEMGRKRTQKNGFNFIPFQLGGENNYQPLADIDVLIHCAYDFSLINPQSIEAIIVQGSIALLKNAQALGVKKIIYFSTTSSFAKTVSDYGKAKYVVEREAARLGAYVVRPGLVFSHKPGGIVGALNKLVMKLPVIPLIGKGEQLFFPCHLNDLAELLKVLIEKNLEIHTPIIAAAEHSISFEEVLLVLAKWHHRTLMLISVPYVFFYIALKSLEMLRLNIGLRSDSLKYMKHYDKHPDFSATRLIGVPFRPFTVQTLSEGVA